MVLTKRSAASGDKNESDFALRLNATDGHAQCHILGGEFASGSSISASRSDLLKLPNSTWLIPPAMRRRVAIGNFGISLINFGELFVYM